MRYSLLPLLALLCQAFLLLPIITASHEFGSVLPVDLPALEDLRVKNLEKIYPAYASFQGQMFAGSLPIDHSTPDGDKRTGNLQFWLFIPDHPTAPDSMVSWFNGGPGCSSLATGLMFEHGPVTVPLHRAGWCCERKDEPLQPNPYGWTNATIMLYVEQPIGVGFSEATNGTPPPSSEDDVAADFEAFLQNFYQIFGAQGVDLTTKKLYLVGESYAGIYIPSIARGIYLRNEYSTDKDRINIKLGGIAIGNGKIDAITQDPAVIDFAYWHGLIDGPTREFLHTKWDSCLEKVRLEDGEIGGAIPGKGKDSSSSTPDSDSVHANKSPFHPFTVRDDCGVLGAILQAAGESSFKKHPDGPNLYEYSTWDAYAAGEGDTGTVGSFYNNVEVQKALNVPEHLLGMHWKGCIPELADMDGRRRLSKEATPSQSTMDAEHPHRKLFMDNDTPWSVVPYLAQLLDEAKIEVLIYSGDRDIICCTQGSEETLRKMDWSGTREAAPGYSVVNGHSNAWSHATRSLWVYNDTYPAGYIKTHKNLQLLTIYNAGHMVPYNQPGPALDMIERFLRGESFH